MDKTFNTWLDFNKCTIVCNNDNFTLYMVTYLQVWAECIPWVRSELLQAESNALLIFIEVKNNDINLLVECNNLVWIAYAAPREVCNMNESVNTTEVNEYTIRSDVLDCTLEYLSFLR